MHKILIILMALLVGFWGTYTFLMYMYCLYRRERDDRVVRWINDKREDARLLTTTGIKRGNRTRKINKVPQKRKKNEIPDDRNY